GFVNGDTTSVLSGSPSLTTAATAASGVGAYAITAAQGSLAASNYVFSFVNGALTITPAGLVVTPGNQTRLHGDTNPALTGTVSGLVNGDAVAASYGTAATAVSDVGGYAITATLSGAALANYAVTYNQGTLTVTPAPLTVTPGDASRLYGDPNPSFTGTVS